MITRVQTLFPGTTNGLPVTRAGMRPLPSHAAERAGQPAPPEPRVAVAQAQNLGATGGFVAPAGSAMTALLDEAGRPNPAAAAWFRIAQAMGLGSVDAAGKFQPWAAVEHAVWFGDTGDVELAFVMADVTKTAADLTRVAGPLLREMRVRSLVGGAFTPRHSDGRVIGRFSNNAAVTPSHSHAAGPRRGGYRRCRRGSRSGSR